MHLGSEVLICYGEAQRTAAEWLFLYGFLPPDAEPPAAGLSLASLLANLDAELGPDTIHTTRAALLEAAAVDVGVEGEPQLTIPAEILEVQMETGMVGHSNIRMGDVEVLRQLQRCLDILRICAMVRDRWLMAAPEGR